MKTLEQYTIDELKVLAYDELAKIEQSQTNLKIINTRIAELLKAKSSSEILQEVKEEIS